MALASTEQPNQITSRQHYLLHLRQRALERMRQDEQTLPPQAPLPPISRRTSLRLLSLAAAAAGTRPLRALAATTPSSQGLLALRSGTMASLRYPAPQYGVPAFPQPSVPYEEPPDAPKLWGGVVQTAITRDELADPRRWTKDYATVIAATGRTQSGGANAPSQVIFYKGPWDKPHAFEVIPRPASSTTYVVPGGQSFYVEDDGDLWAFLIQDRTLYLRKSFFQMATTPDPLADAIRGFAVKVTDRDLRKDEKNTTAIDLGGVPGSNNGIGSVYAVSAKDGKVSIFSFAKGFTVDLKTKKLDEH